MNAIAPILDFILDYGIWIGLIMLYPVWVKIAYLISEIIKYRGTRRQHRLIIRHKHNGKLVKEVVVDLDSGEPLVRQLKKLKESSNNSV